MAATTYDREAAVRDVLTLVDITTIDPSARSCGICLMPLDSKSDQAALVAHVDHPPAEAIEESHHLSSRDAIQKSRPSESIHKGSDRASSETTQEHLPAQLPCNGNHIYGQACITEWLLTNSSCPECRGHVLPLPERRRRTRAETEPIILESWQRSREEYLERLAENSDAYWFVFVHFSPDNPPTAEEEYIAENITNRPELLTDQQYAAARYWNGCQRGGSHRLEYAALARCIEEDSGRGEAEEDRLELVGL